MEFEIIVFSDGGNPTLLFLMLDLTECRSHLTEDISLAVSDEDLLYLRDQIQAISETLVAQALEVQM